MAIITLPAGEKGQSAMGVLPISQELYDFEQQFGSMLKVKDWEAVRIILAIACAHFVPGEPLWVRFLGASRCGKTELLRTILTYPDFTEMEMITPASIQGGLAKGARLLSRINGKLVITKDAAALLTAKSEIRTAIFGLLRNLKDGRLTSDFGIEGAEGHLEQECVIDWILASTIAIEHQRSMEDLLGTRFIDLCWESEDRLIVTRKAIDNSQRLPALRTDLKKAAHHLLDLAKLKQQVTPAPMPSDLDLIADLADLTALLRSPVDRDIYHHLRSMPQPEIGTDIGHSYTRITQGLWLLGITDYKPYLYGLMKDCIPSVRRKVIGELLIAPQGLSAGSIANNTLVPESTVNIRLEDLQLLGICVKSGALWNLKPDISTRLRLLMPHVLSP